MEKKLTGRLPKSDRYLKRLQKEPEMRIHPEVEKIMGVLRADIDAETEHHEHMLRKHQ